MYSNSHLCGVLFCFIIAGMDYQNTSKVFVFTEEGSVTISVSIYDDQRTETTEHFHGRIFVQDTAVHTFIDVSNVTIIDDEGKWSMLCFTTKWLISLCILLWKYYFAACKLLLFIIILYVHCVLLL